MSLGYLAAGVLLCRGFPGLAGACWVSLATVRVSPTFRVFVLHGSDPVSGIEMAVFDNADLAKSSGETEWKPKPTLTLVTGPDGVVDIQNLKPGSYLIETKGPGKGSAVNVEVSAKRVKASNRITLAWPFSSDGILKTRALVGQLASNNPWIPFQDIHVELWTAGRRLRYQRKTPERKAIFISSRQPPEFTFFTSAANKKALVIIGKWKGISLSNSRRLP